MIRRYTLPEMGAIWSESARFEQMLRVELAVARAQARRGLIPALALEVIESRASVDVDRIAEIERTTDHDIIAFVSQVAETIGPEGRYLHLGLTSSDVVDTGLATAVDEIGTGKISGPVGTYSHLDPDIETDVLAELGLHADPVSTQIVQRDRHAALLAAIAILGGTLERI